MVLKRVFVHYRKNFKAAIAFALLLVFVPVFAVFENVFFSSGSAFLNYNIWDLPSILVFIAPFLLFLVFYSFLISIIIFSVRKDLSKLKLTFYLSEMIQKFALKIFIFFVFFSIILFAISMALIYFGVSVLLVSLFLLVVSIALLFVPQSIVVDEENIFHAIQNNFEFIAKNPKAVAQVIVVGWALLVVASLIGELFDLFYFLGAYVSLFLTLIFILPYVEAMKTYLYMLKFDLVKSTQHLTEFPQKK